MSKWIIISAYNDLYYAFSFWRGWYNGNVFKVCTVCFEVQCGLFNARNE